MNNIFNINRDQDGEIKNISLNSDGYALLRDSRLNKGTAFTTDERKIFELDGKLPVQIESIEEQVNRVYAQYLQKNTPLQKNIFLNVLCDTNETLFYRTVADHLDEMLPVIYTPTVGEAVEKFSLQMRRPKGLFISYPDMDKMETLFNSYSEDDFDIIVVTDGEGVLGIGDQGIGGMNISIAKLMVYTLCAGITPCRTLPIQLDVGTNNPQLLNDPMYLGWRHERISGKKYDEFISKFVDIIKRKLPKTFLHWEDFGRENARKNLDKYRYVHQSFNDDIQGTGAVTLAAVLSGIEKSGMETNDHKIVIYGAGTAGVGIADQICKAVSILENTSEEIIRKRFCLIDREGLLTENVSSVLEFQKPYLKSTEDIQDWDIEDFNKILLQDVVKNFKPTILIGCSTVAGAFTSDIIKDMADNTERPIILPLSNPTSKAEAHPKSILKWTDGKALIATGSPFGIVRYGDRDIRISQCNNALIFPGIGLGMLISKAESVTDSMLLAASETLSRYGNKNYIEDTSLLPGFVNIINISHDIALAVANQSVKDNVAHVAKDVNFKKEIKLNSWKPQYYKYIKNNSEYLT
ncbi:MAG TPA: NAD-dependent malic enzyme [Victivallales bacterium]|nr:NAD-dependent malic enzyme [Victivallales bacterium]